FVLMNTGVTRVTVPDGAPVFDSGDTPPIAVTVPTATVPVVHGAPITVRFTAPITDAKPPWPTLLSGTLRFATDALHGPKRQTLAVPITGIVPPKPAPPLPAKEPVPLCAVTCT